MLAVYVNAFSAKRPLVRYGFITGVENRTVLRSPDELQNTRVLVRTCVWPEKKCVHAVD